MSLPVFAPFVLWYAAGLPPNNTPGNQSDDNLFISSDDDGIQLVYCIPINFTKRQTDTSNALAVDKTSPDTGTAANRVELRFVQDRSVAPATNALQKLLHMFYIIASDSDFRKARFGLQNDDNPGLNVEPTSLGGYKLMAFKQEPNPDNPSLNTYTVELEFVGDHTLLGAFA
jgi:hypothetical protein